MYVPDIENDKLYVLSNNKISYKHNLICLLLDYVDNPDIIVFKYNIYHDTNLNKILTFSIYFDISKCTIKHSFKYFQNYYKFVQLLIQ